MTTHPWRAAWSAENEACNPTEADRQAATTEVAEGNRLVVDKKWQAALAHFDKAMKLVCSDMLRFNRGQALGGMPGREAEAFTEFRTFLQRAPGAPKRLRDEAEKQLGRLKPSVGRLAISTMPEGAQVSIDGNPAGASPFAEAVVVAPGVHRLQVAKPGYEDLDVSVKIDAGQDLTQVLTLREVSLTLPTAVAKEPSPVLASPLLTRGRAALVMGGVGVVALGVGAFFGVRALSQAHDCSAGCDAAEYRSNHDARTSALLSDVGLGVGLVAAGVTAYLWKTSSGERQGTKTSLRMGAAAAPGVAQLGLGGTW
ncbi:MAG TPA: PEGA domain-containing protein [Polyangia bacterium]|nr:PEGA domain-containing protein [Polyangia bacterium]